MLGDRANPTAPSLLTFLSTQPGLRQLHLGEIIADLSAEIEPPSDNPLPPASLAAYASLIHSRDLDPTVLDKPHLSPFHPNAQPNYTTNESSYLEEVLGRTLDFERIELKRMLSEGNALEGLPAVFTKI